MSRIKNTRFDIIDGYVEISLLTNCGGFPNIFRNDLVNEFGLLSDFDKAYDIRDKLRTINGDSHAEKSEVWAIFQVEEK